MIKITENPGVGTSVTISVRTGMEVAIDNFFNKQSVVMYPVSEVIGRRLTPFEYYSVMFVFMLMLLFIFVIIVKVKRRKVKAEKSGFDQSVLPQKLKD